MVETVTGIQHINTIVCKPAGEEADIRFCQPPSIYCFMENIEWSVITRADNVGTRVKTGPHIASTPCRAKTASEVFKDNGGTATDSTWHGNSPVI